jgi:hypothetical protein
MNEAVDVSVETNEGDFFQFLSVPKEDLEVAVAKAELDGVALSLVSSDSAALVVPWKLVKRVAYVPVVSEDRDDAWLTIWEKPGADKEQAEG